METHKIANKLSELDPQNNKKPGDKSLTKLSSYQYVEDLVEYYARNNINIRLKICQQLIRASNAYYPYRNGRFSMNQREHDDLVKSGGCYLFIVENYTGVIKARIVRADRVTFANQITWTRLLNGQ